MQRLGLLATVERREPLENEKPVFEFEH